MFVLLIKKLISVFLALLIFGCSEKMMSKMGLRKEQVDAYTVNRKDPLLMPPDMILRPPKEAASNSLENKKLSDSFKSSDISIDDILIGTNIKKDNKSKSIRQSIDIVTNILKAKSDAILK